MDKELLQKVYNQMPFKSGTDSTEELQKLADVFGISFTELLNNIDL